MLPPLSVAYIKSNDNKITLQSNMDISTSDLTFKINEFIEYNK